VAGRRRTEAGFPIQERASSPETRAAAVLQRLAPAELAAVLKILLGRHPNLEGEVVEIGVQILSSPSFDEVSEGVYTALTAVGIDALSGRAGRCSGRYVEPSEAAWEILHEAMGDAIGDMRRRIELGLGESAEVICRGIVAGLRKAKELAADSLLDWAPDFPAEEACHAVAELLRACPKEKRSAVCDRLLVTIDESAPDWSDRIGRAADGAVSGK